MIFDTVIFDDVCVMVTVGLEISKQEDGHHRNDGLVVASAV